MSEVKSVFDFVNDIGFTKEYLYTEQTKSKYESFIVNRAMSQHSDSIMYANEMNKYPELNKVLQHDFYFYVLSRKKRYGKWAKADKEDEAVLNLIIKHYKVNRFHAKQYLELMTDENIKALKNTYEVGGLKK
jgi:hypothetical protein